MAGIPAVQPARDHVRGAVDGRVTLVEYADFQCAYCGDARMGQSLVVTAIAEGRRCARVVDRFLGGSGETRNVPAAAMFAFEDGDPHSLRHQAETARTVTVGDAFWSGPREER